MLLYVERPQAIWLCGLNAVQRWRYRHIPGPRPAWLLGNAVTMRRKMAHIAYEDWKALYGPVFRIFVGMQPYVVISGAARDERACVDARVQAVLTVTLSRRRGASMIVCTASFIGLQPAQTYGGHDQGGAPLLHVQGGERSTHRIRSATLLLMNPSSLTVESGVVRRADPAIIREVGVKQFSTFHDRPIVMLAPAAGRRLTAAQSGMLMARGAYWGSIRAAAQPLFHAARCGADARGFCPAACACSHRDPSAETVTNLELRGLTQGQC